MKTGETSRSLRCSRSPAPGLATKAGQWRPRQPCLCPAVIWLGIGGVILSLVFVGHRYWRPTVVLVASCFTVFSFYALTLYLNMIPITMPGMLKDDPHSVMNVRYGSVMAATMPLFASLFIFAIWRQVQRRRAFSLFLLAPLFLPDPIPSSSHEPMDRQFTQNRFYREAIHNQSFWMPPFVDVASKLKANLDDGLILTNTRIVHVVVWATGIPMRRFVTEMNKAAWEQEIGRASCRERV